MEIIKTSETKHSGKQNRELQVLLGLIDYYIRTGKPVGSSTLKDEGFDFLSSATIRNYFSNLEKAGFLTQTHTSGGRIPTALAFKAYAADQSTKFSISSKFCEEFKELEKRETKEIAGFLHDAVNVLSKVTNTAVFLSSPRFDQDYIIDIKLVPIDYHRCLSIIVTDFGVVKTEILATEKKMSEVQAKKLESYFLFRLNGLAVNSANHLNDEEEALGLKIYNELMVRYIVGYANYSEKEVIRTGFSKLLTYPDFQDSQVLVSSLALFESAHSMRLILKECTKLNRLKFWICDDLSPYTNQTPDCAVIAVPYSINNQSVGAVGLLGPLRMPYRKMFELLNEFKEAISRALTRNVYKYKISFRQPGLLNSPKGKNILSTSHPMLLENQIQEN